MRNRSGETNRFSDAFGRVARLLEKQAFFELHSYSRLMTHGGTAQSEAVRYGHRKIVRNYGSAAPMAVWIVENAIRGVAAEATWGEPTISPRCDWPSGRDDFPASVARVSEACRR